MNKQTVAVMVQWVMPSLVGEGWWHRQRGRLVARMMNRVIGADTRLEVLCSDGSVVTITFTDPVWVWENEKARR